MQAKIIRIVPLLSLYFAMLAAQPLFAQTTLDVVAETAAEDRMKIVLHAAKQHKFAADGEALTRVQAPVLIHKNAVRQFQSGAVYIWEDVDKLPAVIGDIMLFVEDNTVLLQEFHALSRERIEGNLNGNIPWRPAKGLSWEILKDVKYRVESERRFLLVARSLFRRLRGHEIKEDDGETVRRELRTLAQPLHQYKVVKGEVTIRGCIFAFCLDVDPEIIVCIESRQKADGKPEWSRAFGGFSDASLYVYEGQKEVWNDERPLWNPRGLHFGVVARNFALKSDAASD